jgi:hypothetical protein
VPAGIEWNRRYMQIKKLGKHFYICTFGCPMAAMAHDGIEFAEQVKRTLIKYGTYSSHLTKLLMSHFRKSLTSYLK